MKNFLCVVITIMIIVALLIGISDLPPFGNPNNPEHNELSRGYIENAMKDTGVKNIVSAIVLDYRGFDTLIESIVLFSGAIVVITILKS